MPVCVGFNGPMLADRLSRTRLAPLGTAVTRLGSADPLLMASAIAYNTLFAIVPLAIAGMAAISLVGATDEATASLKRLVDEALPSDLAEEILTQVAAANQTLKGAQPLVIILGILVALYAGSRAIYTVIKSLRLVQGTVDTRPWALVRGLGVAFTIGAGLALVVGQVVVFAGRALVQLVESWTGLEIAGGGTVAIAGAVLAAWTLVVLFAIYRWGPPQPAPTPLLSAATTTLLIGAGSLVFGSVLPLLSKSTLGALGAAGVALLYMYYMALILISVPEVLAGTIESIKG